MKFILSLSFLLITLCSKAECGFRGIDIWPDGPTLGSSPTLMIEGYGFSESTILNLNKKHSIYLVSEFDTVRLLVKELLVGEFDLTQASCGPSKWVKFHFEKNDTLAASLIRGTLKNTDTGKEVSYYVLVEENSNFMIGHGMCSGGFLFKDNTEYEIYFELLDEHGNRLKWSGESIKFTSP